jgi:hypothetical protein
MTPFWENAVSNALGGLVGGLVLASLLGWWAWNFRAWRELVGEEQSRQAFH